MPDYSYKAVNAQGGIVEDVLDAPNESAVAEKLDKLGYIPVQIKEKKKSKNIEIFSKGEKVTHDEVVMFTKQLNTLLKAGVPFLTSSTSSTIPPWAIHFNQNIFQ